MSAGATEGAPRGAAPVAAHAGASAQSLSVPRQFLAFDYGSRRIGVATGETLLSRASPLVTLQAEPQAARDAAIDRLVGEWRPDALVVGVPRHPDGTPHRHTARAERFARELQRRLRLPVHLVDERYSSVEAGRDAPRGGGPGGLDAAAAAVILDQFFHHPTAALEPPAAA